MNKIIDSPGQGLLVNRPDDWNNYMAAFWGTSRGRTKRYNIRSARGSVDAIFGIVQSDADKGLGIYFVSPDPTSPSTSKTNRMIQLGIYDGTNEAVFVGIIMSNVLNEIFNDVNVFKLAFSIGRDTGGELIVLVDSVDSSNALIGKGGGDGGDNLTPCKIPNG